MKSLQISFILFLGLFAFQSNAQNVEQTFWVGGVCEMCKERIEKTMDTQGVRFAEYNVDSHELTVAYNTKKVSETEIHALLNNAGHDTAKSKASDEQYAAIHGCCKYRDHKHDEKAHNSKGCCSKDAEGKSSCSKDKKETAASCTDGKKSDKCCSGDKKESCEKKGHAEHKHDEDEH